MIYFAIYLALGLPLVLALVFIAGRDEPVNRIISALVVLIVWPVWTAAIVREKWLMKRVATSCAWCGEFVAVDPKDSKTWEEHALACQKHPLRWEINDLQEKLRQAQNEASWVEPWKLKYEEANRDAFDYKAKWEKAVEKIILSAEHLENENDHLAIDCLMTYIQSLAEVEE